MWLSKFLDFEEDLKKLRSKIKEEIFKNIKKNRLTPLEFTILESIFSSKQLSGYDLIRNLNRHFAGTWEAHSGTVYPILSNLEKDGFLKAQKIKSPIGPLRKVYSLTEAGEELLKHKVNKNYIDQLKFIENFLVELSSIYVHSFPDEERKEKVEEIRIYLKETLNNVLDIIPIALEFKTVCSKCGTEIGREVSFCPNCGTSLFKQIDNKE
ncbi:MAG: helix-turn-helix transcriptional regulator [Candidatus Thorarchaeota archaeon]